MSGDEFVVGGGGDVDPVVDLEFMAIALEESKRDLLCNPADEAALRAGLARSGMDGRYTLRVAGAVPPGKCLIVDVGAIEAAAKEALQSASGWLEQRWAQLEVDLEERRRVQRAAADAAAAAAVRRPLPPPFLGGSIA